MGNFGVWNENVYGYENEFLTDIISLSIISNM